MVERLNERMNEWVGDSSRLYVYVGVVGVVSVCWLCRVCISSESKSKDDHHRRRRHERRSGREDEWRGLLMLECRARGKRTRVRGKMRRGHEQLQFSLRSGVLSFSAGVLVFVRIDGAWCKYPRPRVSLCLAVTPCGDQAASRAWLAHARPDGVQYFYHSFFFFFSFAPKQHETRIIDDMKQVD